MPDNQIYIRFWNQLRELCERRSVGLRFKTNNTQYQWYRDIDIGRRDAHLCLTVHRNPLEITCELQIPSKPELYEKLARRESEIRRRLSSPLLMIAKAGQRMRRIRTVRAANIWEDSDWAPHLDWLLNTAVRFREVFLDLLDRLDDPDPGRGSVEAVAPPPEEQPDDLPSIEWIENLMTILVEEGKANSEGEIEPHIVKAEIEERYYRAQGKTPPDGWWDKLCARIRGYRGWTHAH